MMKRLPTFSRHLQKSFCASVSVYLPRRPHAIIGFMRFAGLDELYDLAPFFYHASSALENAPALPVAKALLITAATRVL